VFSSQPHFKKPSKIRVKAPAMSDWVCEIAAKFWNSGTSLNFIQVFFFKWTHVNQVHVQAPTGLKITQQNTLRRVGHQESILVGASFGWENPGKLNAWKLSCKSKFYEI
jgi:hypothetical protein